MDPASIMQAFYTPSLDPCVSTSSGLPWDVWGEHWKPGEEPTDAQLELFDAIAGLTANPDARFAQLRNRYEIDDALRMDGTVFSAARDQLETV